MDSNMTEEAVRLLAEHHKGFKIVCMKCGGDVVKFDNSMGWSAMSGGWGSFDLTCVKCDNSVELLSNRIAGRRTPIRPARIQPPLTTTETVG